jgi:hypothetical protein
MKKFIKFQRGQEVRRVKGEMWRAHSGYYGAYWLAGCEDV